MSNSEYSRDELMAFLNELIPEGERHRFNIMDKSAIIIPFVPVVVTESESDYGYEPSDADESATIL